MSNFSFNLGNVQAMPTKKPLLAPWGIYDVKFKGCKIDQFNGKREDNKDITYHVFKINFSNDQGYYTETIFYPNEKSGDRTHGKNEETNHEYYLPSQIETTMQIISQLCTVLNPTDYEAGCSQTFTNFDDLCKFVIKITDPKIDTTVKIKLRGKKDKDSGIVNPVLPNLCRVDNDEQLVVCDVFIGDKVAWTPYELSQIKKFKSGGTAKPTQMPEGLDSIMSDNSDLEEAKKGSVAREDILNMLEGK